MEESVTDKGKPKMFLTVGIQRQVYWDVIWQYFVVPDDGDDDVDDGGNDDEDERTDRWLH